MNLLSKEMLASSQSFTPAAPVRREISWFVTDADGQEKQFSAIVFVRTKSFATVSAEAKFVATDGVMASRICASIVDETGQPLFEPADIMGRPDTEEQPGHGPICESLGMALLNAIWEVNGVHKTPDPKHSALKTNSGVNSSWPVSAEEP